MEVRRPLLGERRRALAGVLGLIEDIRHRGLKAQAASTGTGEFVVAEHFRVWTDSELLRVIGPTHTADLP